MNRLSWLAIPAFLFTGCVVSGVGSVEFQWSFTAPNGGTTCADADVQQIQITIGSSVSTFPCNDWASGDGQSATIDGLDSGPLTYSIAGLSFTYDNDGNITGTVASYQGTFTTTVPVGAVDIESITLAPEATPETNSNIILLWTFAGQSCNSAGVTMVSIAITDPVGGNVNTTVDCTGNGVDGASVGASPSVPGSTAFGSGSYPFVLTATGTSASYYASGTLFANGYSDTSAHIDLGVGATAPTTGPGTLAINFAFGASAGTCSSAGLDHLQYYLTDGTGAVVSGSFTDVACMDPASATFTGLDAPATYFLNAEGIAGGTATYEVLQYAVEVYPGTDVTSTYNVDLPLASSL